MVVEAPQRHKVLLTAGADADNATGHNRLVVAGQIEVVQRLPVQPGQNLFARADLFAVHQHIAGDITAIDVQACAQKGNQQAARATARIQRRLPVPLICR